MKMKKKTITERIMEMKITKRMKKRKNSIPTRFKITIFMEYLNKRKFLSVRL